MNISPEIRLWIDRYLNGQLSGSELQEFMERLEKDESFRREVSFQNLLVEGIRAAADDELVDRIVADIGYRKPRVPLALKLIITFVILTAGGIILWNYTGSDQASTFRDKLAFTFLKRQRQPDISDKKSTVKSKTEHLNTESNSKSSVAPAISSVEGEPDPGLVTEESAATDTLTNTPEKSSPDVVVKKDQLLISANIPVIEKGAPEKQDKSDASSQNLSSSATEKLNPEAGLAEEQKTQPDNIETEFWVSPVNYQGYKMVKNKLVLYGIEEPDAVRLFRLNNVLYMRYGNDVYKLTPVEEYASYHKIKETEIPLVLR